MQLFYNNSITRLSDLAERYKLPMISLKFYFLKKTISDTSCEREHYQGCKISIIRECKKLM